MKSLILNDNFSRIHNEQAASTPADTVTLNGDVTPFDLDVSYLGDGRFDLPAGAQITPGNDEDDWVLTMASGNQYHLVASE